MMKKIIIIILSFLLVASLSATIVGLVFSKKSHETDNQEEINDDPTYVGTYGIFEVHKNEFDYFYVINIKTGISSEEFLDVQPLCYTEYKNNCKADYLLVTKYYSDQYLFDEDGLSDYFSPQSYDVLISSSKEEHKGYYIVYQDNKDTPETDDYIYAVIDNRGEKIYPDTTKKLDYAENNKIKVINEDGTSVVINPNSKKNNTKIATYGDFSVYEMLYVDVPNKYFLKNDKTNKVFGQRDNTYIKVTPLCYEGKGDNCKYDYLVLSKRYFGDELFDYKKGSLVFLDYDTRVYFQDTDVNHKDQYILANYKENSWCVQEQYLNDKSCVAKYGITSKDNYRYIDYPYDKAEYYQEGLFKVTVKKKSYIVDGEGKKVDDKMYQDILSSCLGHYRKDDNEYDKFLESNLEKLGYINKKDNYFDTIIGSSDNNKDKSKIIVEEIFNIVNEQNWKELTQAIGYEETCNHVLFDINNIKISNYLNTRSTEKEFVYESNYDISNPKKLSTKEIGKYVHVVFNDDNTIDVYTLMPDF